MARILVVDEDPRVRRSVAVSLRVDGHKVVEADRAEDGVRLGRGGRFDLVILDCSLAEGPEIITAIHNTLRVPIIVLSTCTAEARKVEAFDRGANRAGRVCSDRNRRWISGSSAGCPRTVSIFQRHVGRA